MRVLDVLASEIRAAEVQTDGNCFLGNDYIGLVLIDQWQSIFHWNKLIGRKVEEGNNIRTENLYSNIFFATN